MDLKKTYNFIISLTETSKLSTLFRFDFFKEHQFCHCFFNETITDRLEYREWKTLVVYSDDPGEPHGLVSRYETVHLGDLDEGVQEGIPQ